MSLKQWLKNNKLQLLLFFSITFISLFIGLYEIDFTKRDFNVLFTYGSGDGFSFLADIQSLRESGLKGLYFKERLGAPDVCSYVDVSSIDPLLAISLILINLFTDSAVATCLVYFVFTFIITTWCMYWLLKKFEIHPLISGVFSLLYSFAPYHFYRGVGHANLICIFTIPLGVAVAFYIAFQNDKDGVKDIFSHKNVMLCSILIGFSCAYYLFFLLFMYAVAYIVMLILQRKQIHGIRDLIHLSIQKLWGPILSITCLLIGQLPRVIYGIITGMVNNAMARSPFEAEIYALKYIQLFLPASYHNNKYLRSLTSFYSNNAINVNENSFATLGLIASIGIIILLILFFVRLIAAKNKFGLMEFLSISTAMYLFLACTGGFGEIFNMILTPQFRCYNRVSIVLTAIGLIAVAMLLQKLLENKKKVAMILTVITFIIGMYDQVPFEPMLRYDSSIVSIQSMYETFFDEIENELEPKSMVYQLPYALYPESSAVNDMEPFAHLKAYIFTENIRWSYGAIEGRDTSAEELLDNNGMSYLFVQNLLNAGFSGVYIDTDGYLDDGVEIIEFYDGLGIKPIVSGDGKLYFYNILNVNLDQRKLKNGYAFVEKMMKTCDVTVDVDYASKVADDLFNNTDLAVDEIYEMLEQSGITSYSDEDYISFLYDNILGRSSGAGEIDSWKAMIEDGTSYNDILFCFIASNEFRDANS